jgi:hypothetical protein
VDTIIFDLDKFYNGWKQNIGGHDRMVQSRRYLFESTQKYRLRPKKNATSTLSRFSTLSLTNYK